MPDSRYVTTKDDLVAELNKLDPGGTLLVSRGHHVVDAPLRNNLNGITIRGESFGKTVITRNGDFPLFELVGTQRRGERRSDWKFQDLQLQARPGDSSDLIRIRYGGNHWFQDVLFEGERMSGNGVFAEETWNLRFVNCGFGRSGHPSEGTADVYAYNGDYDNTNSVMFLNCAWDRPSSHAIYSDSSGKGGVNDRFYLSNCKMLGVGRGGQVEEDPECYYVDGVYRGLKIVNSNFRWSLQGFLRNESGGSVQVSNCKFHRYGGDAIRVESADNVVSSNVFESEREGSTAVRTTGADNSIIGNRIDDERGITVEGDRTAVTDNAVAAAAGDAITADAEDPIVRGNTVREAGRHGIVVSGGGAIVSSNRCVEPSRCGIALPDARYGIVSGNLVRGAGGEPIRSTGGADYLFVVNNMCLGEEPRGVSLAGDGNEVGPNVTGSATEERTARHHERSP